MPNLSWYFCHVVVAIESSSEMTSNLSLTFVLAAKKQANYLTMIRKSDAERERAENLRIEEEREAIYDNPPAPSGDVEVNVANALMWHTE